jgi:hypothetical protein
MGKKELSEIRRDSARRILWGDREMILPHLMEDHSCYVRPVVEEMVARSGWTYDSYFLACFFDSRELLVEQGTEAKP